MLSQKVIKSRCLGQLIYSTQSSTLTSKVIGTSNGSGVEPLMLNQGQLGSSVRVMTLGWLL